MKKIKDFLIKNRRVIFMCLVIFVLFIGFSKFTYAKINSSSDEIYANKERKWTDLLGSELLGKIGAEVEEFLETVASNLLNAVGQVAAGTLMKLLNVFVLACAAVVFMLFFAFWSIFGGSIFDLPWPDKIVFNKMAMFDPNFINPDPNASLVGYAKNTQFIYYLEGAVRSVYFSFFVVAGALMVIAALIIGIKLAITSISIEKAQYKEALNKWIVGMVLLFSLHFIILGMFTINEKVCEIADKASQSVEIRYNITDLNIVTKAASVVKSIFSGIAGLIKGEGLSGFAEGDIVIKFHGYTGVVFYLLFNAVFNLDLISSITVLAILGQTINLIFKYIKRLFYIVFLAMIAPLVVAVDVIRRVI